MQNEEVINVLLLSETGVGKSTFINSLVNYLQFSSFADACNKIQHLHCIIPTKFIVTDGEFTERIIECGSNDNESTMDGASATLKTKSYLIKVPTSNITLRIIDTPGIGDTQGIMQDAQNQLNIMSYLSCISYLNVVCILLKPNQTRCTIAFQYCINQLLSYLHKSAIENIMFVFTNTRPAFFTPGDTTHSLQKVLKDVELKQNIVMPFSKENIFCIDNEPFRYLLTKKCGIEFENEHTFANSFSHSRSECLRIIHYAKATTPYTLNDTIFLSTVRRKFESLCHTLSDMSGLLKSDSILLKRMHNMPEDFGKMDVSEIESRMSKTEAERDNVVHHLSKFVLFLKANSVVLFNDYSHGYINYLIDQEVSKGTETNQHLLRDYWNLLSFYENIKNIINRDSYTDPLLPSLITEELLSLYPELNKEINNINNNIADNEIVISLSTHTSIAEENKVEENNSASFSFEKWFEQLQESVSCVSNNLEKSVEYEELRNRFVKSEFQNANTKKNFNNPNYKKIDRSNSNFPKVEFKKTPRSSNLGPSKPSKERNKDKRSGGASSANLKDMSSSFCFLDQLDTVCTEENIGKNNDDFVILNGPSAQNPRSRNGPRGRGRGRGRGKGGSSSECKQLPKKEISSNSHRTDTNNTRSASSASRINSSQENNTQLPKNILQSMKTIFD